MHNIALLKQDIIDDEEAVEEDGRESIAVDAIFGVNEAGTDKRHWIMRSLSEL